MRLRESVSLSKAQPTGEVKPDRLTRVLGFVPEAKGLSLPCCGPAAPVGPQDGAKRSLQLCRGFLLVQVLSCL